MAIQNNDKKTTAQKMIEQIRAVGQSLIDNAERIYNTFEFSCGTKITVELTPKGAPTIKVEKEFYPETYIEQSPYFKKD